jgi:hypothetical protein
MKMGKGFINISLFWYKAGRKKGSSQDNLPVSFLYRVGQIFKNEGPVQAKSC